MKALYSDVKDACTLADTILWDAYARSAKGPSAFGEARLVFPQFRDTETRLRVSEQEARFAFVEALCQRPLRYSVEAPTSKLYRFSGQKPRSAQTDLQVHDVSQIGICNVEFKAKGASPNARNNVSIYKDLQKLLREPRWGLWFHLLESIDNSTINNFLDVMAQQIGKVQNDFQDVETPGLTIHVCMLRHGFSLEKDVRLLLGGGITNAELNGQLRIDLHVSQSELINVHDVNGWKLNRRCSTALT